MGFFPEGKDGEKFRRDMRMFGVASGFFASAGIGIFCGAEFAVAAPGEGYGWLAGSVFGGVGAFGALIDLKSCFKTAAGDTPPSQQPPAEPPSPSAPE